MLARLLEIPFLVRVGVISYSVFLWHEPLIRWLSYHSLTLSGATGFGVNLVVLGTISIVLSTITYRYVELPALQHKFHSSVRSAPALGQNVSPGKIQAAP